MDYYFIISILIGGALLTFARRWKNENKSAGMGIAGWTIVFVFLYMWFQMNMVEKEQKFQHQMKLDSVKIEMEKLRIQKFDND